METQATDAPTPWAEAVALIRARWPDVAGPAELPAIHARLGAPAELVVATDDDRLAWGCVLGSSAAVRALDAQCLAPVVPRLRGMGLAPSSIDDVLADVRGKLVTGDRDRLPALARRHGRGSLAGYVRAIAVRHAIDGLRASAATTAIGDDAELDELARFATRGVEAELARAQHADAVRAAFAQAWAALAPHVRLLLTQQVIDRLTIDEIGALHGVHRATAARRCVAARETLLARLRAALRDTLGVHTGTADSILRNAGSRLSGVLVAHGHDDL